MKQSKTGNDHNAPRGEWLNKLEPPHHRILRSTEKEQSTDTYKYLNRFQGR